MHHDRERTPSIRSDKHYFIKFEGGLMVNANIQK